MILSSMEIHILNTFLTLKPVNLSLTQLLLMLFKIQRRLTKINVATHLHKIMPYIFLAEIIPDLFFSLIEVF